MVTFWPSVAQGQARPPAQSFAYSPLRCFSKSDSHCPKRNSKVPSKVSDVDRMISILQSASIASSWPPLPSSHMRSSDITRNWQIILRLSWRRRNRGWRPNRRKSAKRKRERKKGKIPCRRYQSRNPLSNSTPLKKKSYNLNPISHSPWHKTSKCLPLFPPGSPRNKSSNSARCSNNSRALS